MLLNINPPDHPVIKKNVTAHPDKPTHDSYLKRFINITYSFAADMFQRLGDVLEETAFLCFLKKI